MRPRDFLSAFLLGTDGPNGDLPAMGHEPMTDINHWSYWNIFQAWGFQYLDIPFVAGKYLHPCCLPTIDEHPHFPHSNHAVGTAALPYTAKTPRIWKSLAVFNC